MTREKKPARRGRRRLVRLVLLLAGLLLGLRIALPYALPSVLDSLVADARSLSVGAAQDRPTSDQMSKRLALNACPPWLLKSARGSAKIMTHSLFPSTDGEWQSGPCGPAPRDPDGNPWNNIFL